MAKPDPEALAAALRANLRRRKAQRRDPGATVPAARSYDMDQVRPAVPTAQE